MTTYSQVERKVPIEKVSKSLKQILTQNESDSIIVIISFKVLAREVKYPGIILYQYPASGATTFKTTIAIVKSIIKDDQLLFADVLRTPKEELTTGAYDLSANRINFAHHNYIGIKGDQIKTSVKEQKLDTTDIDFKGRYFNSGVSANTTSSHASIMATILAGGANSSPFAKGVAWGADITSSSFTNLLPDPDEVFKQYAITVQNHSYGTDIENYYGNEAAAYDVNTFNNKTLVHIFSAGNRGTSSATTGNYSGIGGFANLTGTFKMAKNIITVGHIDSIYSVIPPSSRGPAFDGRVKPELVAFGEDGSSGAAAMVSGAAALIQDAYKQMKNSLPSSSLVKAVLLNSAEDVGNKEIDFASGYGSLNVDAAIKTITAENYIEDEIDAGNTKTYSFTIPAATAQFKLTLAWTDTAAIPNAQKALVNDLDAYLKFDATGAEWQPWVLNSFPHRDSLMQQAVRKIDTLNNVEQISMTNPQPGVYTLHIKGEKISTANQLFSIAYQLDSSNSFSWTYPTSSDVLLTEQTNILRWHTNINANAAIDYSFDKTNWLPVTAATSLSQQYYKWNAPDTVATAFIRMTIPGLSAPVVSDTFVIARSINLNVGYNCLDSFLLFWTKLPVNTYELYSLDEKYMQPVALIQDTFKVLQKQQDQLFYSIAPLINNKPGLRSYTVNYSVQGVDCYFRSFYGSLDDQTALLTTILGTLAGVQQIKFQKFISGQYQTINTINQPASTVLNYADNNLLKGINQYRVLIQLTNGSIIESEPVQIYYLPGDPVIVFPNPANINERINIIAKDIGIYKLQVFDANGRKMHEQVLNNVLTQLPSFTFSRGLYFIRVIGEEGFSTTQKIIVY